MSRRNARCCSYWSRQSWITCVLGVAHHVVVLAAAVEVDLEPGVPVAVADHPAAVRRDGRLVHLDPVDERVLVRLGAQLDPGGRPSSRLTGGARAAS